MGLGCRPVTITAFAYLTILDAGDLLDAMSTASEEPKEEVAP